MTEVGKGFRSGRLGSEANYLASQEFSLRAAGRHDEADAIRNQIGLIQQRAGVFAPRVQKVEDAWANPADAPAWLGGVVGQVGSSMTDSVGTGLAASKAAQLVGMLPHPAAKAIGRAGSWIGAGAAAVPNVLQARGETANAMVEDPTLMANTTAEQRNNSAWVSGAAQGAIDTVLPSMMVSRLGGAGIAKGVAKLPVLPRVAADMALEGGQEVVQEGMKKGTLSYLNPERDTSGDASDYLNSFASGLGTAPHSAATIAVDNGFRRLGVKGDGQRGDDVDLGDKSAGKDIMAQLTAAAKTPKAMSAADAGAYRDLLHGSDDLAGEPETMERRKVALLEELAKQPGDASAASLAQRIAPLDFNTIEGLDGTQTMDEAAAYLAPRLGLTTKELVKKAAASKGRKNSLQSDGTWSSWPADPAAKIGAGGVKFSADGTPVAAGDANTPVTPGEVDSADLGRRTPALQQRIIESRQQHKTQTARIASLLENTYTQQYADAGTAFNPAIKRLLGSYAPELAAIMSPGVAAAPTAGDIARAKRIGSSIGSALGDKADGALVAVAQRLAVKNSPVFDAMHDEAVKIAKHRKSGDRAVHAQHAIERDAAALALLDAVPEFDAEMAKQGADLRLEGNDHLREQLLRHMEDHADGEGTATRAQLEAQFGKEGYARMMEIVGGPIAPRHESIDYAEQKAKAAAKSSDDNVEETTDFEKRGAEKSHAAVDPGSLVFGHSQTEPRTAADAFKPDAKGEYMKLVPADRTDFDGKSSLSKMQQNMAQSLRSQSKGYVYGRQKDGKIGTSAKELMDRQKMPEDQRVALMGAHLGQENKGQDHADFTATAKALPILHSADRVLSEAVQAKGKDLGSAEANKQARAQLRRVAMYVANPERFLDTDMPATQTQRHEQTLAIAKAVHKAHADVRAGMIGHESLAPMVAEFKAAHDGREPSTGELANHFFGNRFLIHAEKLSDRDYLKIDNDEFTKLHRQGNELLRTAENQARESGGDVAEHKAGMNLIHFRSLSAVGQKKVAAQDKAIAIPAHKLVAWVRDMRNKHTADKRTGDNTESYSDDEKADQYLDDLKEGINALMTQKLVRGTPWIVNAAGAKEFFGADFDPADEGTAAAPFTRGVGPEKTTGVFTHNIRLGHQTMGDDGFAEVQTPPTTRRMARSVTTPLGHKALGGIPPSLSVGDGRTYAEMKETRAEKSAKQRKVREAMAPEPGTLDSYIAAKQDEAIGAGRTRDEELAADPADMQDADHVRESEEMVNGSKRDKEERDHQWKMSQVVLAAADKPPAVLNKLTAFTKAKRVAEVLWRNYIGDKYIDPDGKLFVNPNAKKQTPAQLADAHAKAVGAILSYAKATEPVAFEPGNFDVTRRGDHFIAPLAALLTPNHMAAVAEHYPNELKKLSLLKAKVASTLTNMAFGENRTITDGQLKQAVDSLTGYADAPHDLQAATALLARAKREKDEVLASQAQAAITKAKSASPVQKAGYRALLADMARPYWAVVRARNDKARAVAKAQSESRSLQDEGGPSFAERSAVGPVKPELVDANGRVYVPFMSLIAGQDLGASPSDAPALAADAVEQIAKLQGRIEAIDKKLLERPERTEANAATLDKNDAHLRTRRDMLLAKLNTLEKRVPPTNSIPATKGASQATKVSIDATPKPRAIARKKASEPKVEHQSAYSKTHVDLYSEVGADTHAAEQGVDRVSALAGAAARSIRAQKTEGVAPKKELPGIFKNAAEKLRGGETIQQVNDALAAKATGPRGSTASTSKTPVFDALPSHTPGQKTMTYAGIGSRRTTPAVLKQMAAAAKQLAAMGYTLMSGGALGADSAFEQGAEGKARVFKANDATNQTRAIAKEIHPAPGALGIFPLNLMARNTNQVFGADLKTPVDFVLTWTPDGAESTAERTRDTGGTGQAIDMASRKGVPVINMARPDWQARVRAIVRAGEAPKAEAPKAEPSVRDMPMNYKDGTDGLAMRPEYKGKSTMDLIREGVRTATTGARSRFAGLNVGDVFTVVGGDGERIKVRLTQLPERVNSMTAEEWSAREGWAPKEQARYMGAYQARYELVGKPVVPSTTATATLADAIAKRQDYLDNPPADYTGEAAQKIADWATKQLVRVDAAYAKVKDSDNYDRTDELSDRRFDLRRLIESAKKSISDDADARGIDARDGTNLFGRKNSTQAVDAKGTEAEPALSETERKVAMTVFETPKDRDIFQAKMYLKKTLGDKITNLFAATFDDMAPGAGADWSHTLQTVRIATANPVSILQRAYHESMHAFFSNILEHSPEAKALMLRTFSTPAMVERMAAILKDSPDAVAALRTDPEEAAAYGYQLWAAGLLTVGKTPATFFEKVQRFLSKVFGMVRDSDKALAIMTSFHDGKLTELSAAGVALDKIMKSDQWRAAFLKKHDKAAQALHSELMASINVGLTSESPAARAFAKMFYHHPAVGEGEDATGLIDARLIKHNQYQNLVWEALKPLRGDNEVRDMAELGRVLNEHAEPTQPAVAAAAKSIRAAMTHFLAYAKEAGVDIGTRDGDKYFPRVVALEYLIEHKKDFTDMLVSKYPAVLKSMVPSLARAKKGSTIEEAAAFIHQQYVDHGGVEESKLSVMREDGVLNPFFASQNERSLHWIRAEDIGPFLSKDLVSTMTRYFAQGVRSAEYVRRFGEDGQKLKDGMARLGDVRFIDKETGHVENYDADGPVLTELKAAAAKEGLKGVPADEWVNRRMEDLQRSFGAMEGSLGKDITAAARQLQGWAMVYQVLRTLPLSLFSAMLDPNGIRVAGGTNADMWEAYRRGMVGVFRNWKDMATGAPLGMREAEAYEREAEAMGVIGSGMALEEMGAVHGSEYESGAARRINHRFFMWNGITAWDRQMRMVATGAAMRSIVNNEANGVPAHSARWLKDLGLTQGDGVINTDADGKLIWNRHALAALRAEKNGTTSEQEMERATEDIGKITVAVNRWVSRAIMAPNAALRPSRASDPHYAMFFQLKSFTYAFQETTMRYALEEAKKGNMDSGLQMLRGVPIMIAADMTKAVLTNGGSLPGYMANWTMADWVMNAAQRGGLAGTGQFGLDTLHNPHGLFAGVASTVGGPAVSQGIDAVAGAMNGTLGSEIIKGIPLVNKVGGLAHAAGGMVDFGE